MQQLHQRLADQRHEAIVTLRTNVSVPVVEGSQFVVQRPRWLTVVDADKELISRAQKFATALTSVRRVTARLVYAADEHGEATAPVTAAATPF